MSLSLKISDAAFTKFVSQLPPYISLAKAFYLFGGTQAASLKNYANNALPATVVGTPTYGAGYANLTSSANGFDSGISSNRPFTHIAVVAPMGSVGGYMGNWTPSLASNLVAPNSGQLSLAMDGNFRVSTPSGFLNAGAFQLIASSCDGTTSKVYVHDAAQMAIGSVAFTPQYQPQPFRVGGSGYSDTTVFKAAAAMTFQQALTDGQVGEIYAYLKALLAGRGVAVL